MRTALNSLDELRMVQGLIDPLASLTTRAGFHPACDIEETEVQYVVSFDLPGVPKENVKIELEDNELSVSGERKEWRKEWRNLSEHEDTNGNGKPKSRFHFAERTLGKFHRVFTIPTAVDPAAVKARFMDGVLQITLPKAEAAKPRQIQIGE